MLLNSVVVLLVVNCAQVGKRHRWRRNILHINILLATRAIIGSVMFLFIFKTLDLV